MIPSFHRYPSRFFANYLVFSVYLLLGSILAGNASAGISAAETISVEKNIAEKIVVEKTVVEKTVVKKTSETTTKIANQSDAVILVVGDSLSAAYGINESDGWVNLLKQRLDDQVTADKNTRYQVINASISGDTTAGGKRRLKRLLDQWHPALVVLELGGNDGLRGVQIPTIKSNLAAMIEQSQTAAADVLLVGMHIPPNYGPRYTGAFHNLFVTLAEKYSISLVPFLLEDVATRAELMQADGIHPTAEAQSMMLDNVWPVLERLLE